MNASLFIAFQNAKQTLKKLIEMVISLQSGLIFLEGEIDAGISQNSVISGGITCSTSILRRSIHVLNAAYRPSLIYFCVHTWVSVYLLVFKE